MDTNPFHVSDAVAQMGMLGTTDTVLAHRLGIARELLLRNLREQMRSGPLMNSPQVLRDWLRLYCVGLEHEVCCAILSSFDQDGISPQRAGSAKRWPSWTWMIGAMLVGRTSGLLYGSGSASKMK